MFYTLTGDRRPLSPASPADILFHTNHHNNNTRRRPPSADGPLQMPPSFVYPWPPHTAALGVSTTESILRLFFALTSKDPHTTTSWVSEPNEPNELTEVTFKFIWSQKRWPQYQRMHWIIMRLDIPRIPLRISRPVEIVRRARERVAVPGVHSQRIRHQSVNIVANTVASSLACHGIWRPICVCTPARSRLRAACVWQCSSRKPIYSSICVRYIGIWSAHRNRTGASVAASARCGSIRCKS